MCAGGATEASTGSLAIAVDARPAGSSMSIDAHRALEGSPMTEVLFPVIAFISLLAAVIAVGILVFRAFLRRTEEASSRNIAFGLVTAFATALLVFILVYLAAWAELRQGVAMGRSGYERITRRHFFGQVQRVLSDYAQKHGHYPDSLEHVPELEDLVPLDPWHRPYEYSKTEDGFSLLSFGRDGKPGGVGLDADFYLDEEGGPIIEPTLSQFLFEAAGGGTLFIVAILASCFAGMTCYIASGSQRGQPVAIGSLLLSVAIAAVGAIVVSLVLVSIYLFGLPH